MVEVSVYDYDGEITLTLSWRKRSRRVCYQFSDARIAKASFKLLARILGVEEGAWEKLGI